MEESRIEYLKNDEPRKAMKLVTTEILTELFPGCNWVLDVIKELYRSFSNWFVQFNVLTLILTLRDEVDLFDLFGRTECGVLLGNSVQSRMTGKLRRPSTTKKGNLLACSDLPKVEHETFMSDMLKLELSCSSEPFSLLCTCTNEKHTTHTQIQYKA